MLENGCTSKTSWMKEASCKDHILYDSRLECVDKTDFLQGESPWGQRED